MDWTTGNKAGRTEAAQAIQTAQETGDLPALVAAIRHLMMRGRSASCIRWRITFYNKKKLSPLSHGLAT